MTRTIDQWVGSTPDAAIPDRVKVRIFTRDNGRCCECTRKCGTGGEPYQFDHVIALINGGAHAESNLRLVCTECHKSKTKADVAEKAKVYAVKRKHLGLKRKRRTIPGRKFDGTPIPSRWVER